MYDIIKIFGVFRQDTFGRNFASLEVCRKVKGGRLFDISSFIQANNTGMSELDIRRAFADCDRDKSGDLDMSEYSRLHAGLETEQELKQGRNKQKRKPDGASAMTRLSAHVHIRHCLNVFIATYIYYPEI